ncbi:hypothetical protein [Aureimonas populi]|uniref:DUF2219 family protein n=1 Tax=Aureimonas populi TaxID=1701758 RepID=A0ABW5CMH6_9HYPH|nr:hypothetical protein [Aureimonas populi]
MGRGRRAACGALAAALLLAPGEKALAGAWTQEKGRGLVIATLAGASASRAFDGDGALAAAPAWRKAEIHVLAEYGISDRFTLRGKGHVERWRLGAPGAGDHAGWGVQEIGGRYRLVESGPFIGSVEASLRVADAHDRTAPEFEGRLLAGYGFELRGLPSFLDMQAGWRHRPQREGDEVLLDLTFGTRLAEPVLLLLQSFSAIEPERGASLPAGSQSHKLQASAVLDVSESLSLQAGLFRTLMGVSTLEEEGAFVSLWLRF